ncbi:hypothetical protein [Aestuariirhabdus litorea]|uniref:Asparagine synthetase domain-containing protein n=1 Tax=Aestuariirhabdus litorea TaxID=2528527 RepID=A0A3P3VQ89_9GAMM|nr:hypothetical protein [Aestuariirhabdus litorea]RRJ84614.1 hypothetical protein D0544_05785 [Aestuariirhabdus litorea]RWW97840.1 hypothetical protein DZC74_05780 [Endozoicomonadaceae bacterium GTF-13]
MELNRVLDERMPPLGWLLATDFKQLTVVHGTAVEWIKDRLVEGVWSEPFERSHPELSMNLFGSCVHFEATELLISASVAPSEPLFFYHQDGCCLASNSQVLLLAAMGDRLKAGYGGYEALNWLRTRGLESVITPIPLQSGVIHRFIHHSLRLSAQGYEIVKRPTPPPFNNYGSYQHYLQRSLNGCLENGCSSHRQHPLELLTTQSQGYDSTAINALVDRKFRIKAYTCRDSKPIGEVYRPGSKSAGPSDDGSAIAAQLGIECEGIERDEFTQHLRLEPYLNAAVHNNEDRNLLPIFARVRSHSLLLTGMMGELWYTHQGLLASHFAEDADNQLKRGDLGGFGVNELRLWCTVTHLPVPHIGAVQRESIHRIAETEEMAPWRLNTDYDRPIARRIAEEAGVGRESFGQKKMGAVVIMPTPELPLDADRRRLYLRDLARRGLLHPLQRPLIGLAQRYNNWLQWKNPNRYFSNRQRYPLAYYLSRALEKLSGHKFRFRPLFTRLNSELYRFSCNELADRYDWLAERIDLKSASTAVAQTPNEHSHQHQPCSEHL